MRAVALAAILLLLSSNISYSITCSPKPGKGSGWSWRSIDGKRCWFKGDKRTPKSRLAWPKSVPLPAPSPLKEEEKRLLESVWPELPPPTFEERFRGYQR